MEDTDLYSRDRISSVMARSRSAGGIAQTAQYTRQLTSWFCMLTKKGHTVPKFLADHEVAMQTFTDSYPNPSTRGQYILSFMKYLAALSDDEFQNEFTDLKREEIVALLQNVIRGVSKQRKEAKANAEKRT